MGCFRRSGLVVAAAASQQLAAVAERPDVVIAADSGLHTVMARGWIPDRVVGDMDSVDTDVLAAAERGGASIQRHEIAKDETDLELALEAVTRAGVTDLHVVARGDGRLDHQLANLAALAAPRLAEIAIFATIGEHSVWVVRGRREIALAVGDHVALQPIGGEARVTTRGVAFPLRDETLSAFGARGIANRVTESPVTVEVARGVVLVTSSPEPLDRG